MLMMFQRAMLVVQGIAGLAGIMLMAGMLLHVHGNDDIARIRR
jgi:hypothetical protein